MTKNQFKSFKSNLLNNGGHYSLNYRPDIDGLRAFAVIFVLLFHAFPDWFPGGFIGVDIFFIISGFLISSIIFKGLEQGNFSFVDFYSRRVRRIFPALILVLAVSLAWGWMALLSGEYKALGKHVAGGAGFISNIILMAEVGYMDDSAMTRPLLHLWSLGVEEQFYVVWPLIVWVVWKCRLPLPAIIGGLALLSFMWCIVPALHIFPPMDYVPAMSNLRMLLRMDATSNFYLPQARFWELLIGAFVGYVHCHPKWNGRLTHQWRSYCCALGVVLIAAGLVLINRKMIFPGFWALLPTIGTALLIIAGSKSWFNRVVLSRPLLVGIGKISYPLYLWHWPVLIFVFITYGSEQSYAVRIACLAICVLLAWLTYQWVEKPIRYGKHASYKTIALVLIMAVVGGAGYKTFSHDGWGNRAFAKNTQPINEAMQDWRYPGDLSLQTFDGIESINGGEIYGTKGARPQVVFLGDSHIRQYASRVWKVSQKKHIPVSFVTWGGCQLVMGVYDRKNPTCFRLLDNLQKILDHSPSVTTIVIGNFWGANFFDDLNKDYQRANIVQAAEHNEQKKPEALKAFQSFLKTLTKRYKVYVILDNPNGAALNPRYMIGNRLAFENMLGLPPSMLLPQKQLEFNRDIRKVSIAAGARVIDPMLSLCPQGVCKRFTSDGAPIYYDDNHLRASYVEKNAHFIDEVFSAH